MHQGVGGTRGGPQVDRKLRVRGEVHAVRRVRKPGQEGVDQELETLL
jgi:hypothetical protein